MGGNSKNKKKPRSSNRKKPIDHGEEITESRFAAAATHPQFRPLQQKESKVVLDDRFSSVLTDPRFQLEGRDKYGRGNKKGKKAKAAKNAAVKEELSSFYVVDDEETKGDDEATKSKKDQRPEDSSSDHDSGNESSDSDDSDNDSKENNKADKKEDPASRIAYLTALSRGKLEESSSSDDDDDDDDSSQSSDDDDDDEGEKEGEDPVYGSAGILDPSTQQEEDVEISYDSSPYLVVQNMDWEHIRAVDLFSLLNSFTAIGAVKRVQVFQSDFGKERMERDRSLGPNGIWKKGGSRVQKQPLQTKKMIGEEDSDDESS
ncbi:MAG: hypothetical protein SGBAC_012461, partial [Bacillariaceae sp.]